MRESSFYQEIVEEGEQIARRKTVLEMLELRFGTKAAEEFAEAVNQIDNLDQLKELLKIAAKSRRLSQFRRALPAP